MQELFTDVVYHTSLNVLAKGQKKCLAQGKGRKEEME